ncbi:MULTISPECIES: IclR family transcriptional regulator [Mameliella]|uniref:IclR family transcriptional regulator n=1 Tax=Mameliella TaxID=1434019 RepID=UPI000B531252|nr:MULTISPECIES: IclR family transcriptional regulator [Mameliella]MBV6634456.1 IclR family transcriptional regulator [Mameliella sp.]MCR9275649.1 IclR family transcriptional regulator [Paracoccaceae bacterium]OWV54039.1 transcriptional regulator [Mameliella alba]
MTSEQAGSTTKRQVPAVTRALAILRFLARSPEPVGVNPMARELDLVPSTCLHILRVLQDEGMVDFDSQTKRYTIGIGILPLARSALQRNSFSTLIQPQLSELSQKFGVTSIATQLSEPNQMIVVALSQSSMPFRLQVDLGSRFPALISATGRLFAAFNVEDEQTLRQEFDRLVWDHPPAFEDWVQEIREARERGYAVDQGTYISGVTVVAVPVFGNSGRMTRSIVAIGISERLKDKQVPKLTRAMQGIRDHIQELQIDAGS